jgi:hypothetical protein
VPSLSFLPHLQGAMFLRRVRSGRRIHSIDPVAGETRRSREIEVSGR